MDNILVVGAGVTGLTTTYLLSKIPSVKKITLIESQATLGGHALTVETKNKVTVDLGFQVYNLTTYPILTKLFDELNVDTEPSDMSFSCSSEKWEWASHDLNSLFATRSNLVSPAFWKMVREIFRFAREADRDLPAMDEITTLRCYLERNAYDASFSTDYLLPMTAAVWSVPYEKMMDFPVKSLVRFWKNHHLLDPLGDRPKWRVVKNRSSQYVAAVARELIASGKVDIRTRCRAEQVSTRTDEEVRVIVNGREEVFDRVVFCTHSDITLELLGAFATDQERATLGAIQYEPNRVILHSDEKLMPRSRNAWASWNVLQNDQNHNAPSGVCVTYWLNRLQNLPSDCETLLCTLNPIIPIEPRTIQMDLTLFHPVFNVAALQAQTTINQSQANPANRNNRIWLAGAYLGNGFHEDGARAALAVVQGLTNNTNLGEGWSLQAKGPSPTLGSSRYERIGIQMFSFLAKRFIHRGHLHCVLPNGEELSFGRTSRESAIQENEPVCHIRVNDVAMFNRLIRDSDIGLGEAYMERLFELPKAGHNDLIGLFDLLLENRNSFGQYMAGAFNPISWIYRFGNFLQHWRHANRANTIDGSRKNIHAHYDLGNEFYSLFLDETMTYSSGIHSSHPNMSLRDAQLAKYDRLIQQARLTKGSKLLEIGCGWGGLAIRAAQTTGCQVFGITISTEQLAFAKKRVEELNLQDSIQLSFCDYRKLPEVFELNSFDAIISIEMLEAVGHENLPVYFNVVNQMIKPGKPAVIQVIGMPDSRYQEYLNSSDFIRAHIFPGGHLPSMGALKQAIATTDLTIGDVFDIGPDYAESLLAWRLAFFARKNDILALGMDEVFFRKWLFYFAYCEVGFRKKYIYDWQIVFEKKVFPLKTSSANNNNNNNSFGLSSVKIDLVTATFFCAWFFLCGLAVAEKGRHLLVIPLVMLVCLLVHLFAFTGTERRRYETAAIVIYACGLLVATQSRETIILMGAGILTADLFSLTGSGSYVNRIIRVLFLAVQVSYFGVAAYHPDLLPLGNLLSQHWVSTSLIYLFLHLDFLSTNLVFKTALLVSISLDVHNNITWGLTVSDPLAATFALAALLFDVTCLTGMAPLKNV